MTEPGLHHVLRRRHMTMIALGGVIGAGLFVGSRVVIQSAGPAACISFLITGGLVVLVMRMLGEMATALPAAGSFYDYARSAMGELAGFATGWMYWYFWVIVVAMEAIAGADLLRLWIPAAPQWLLTLVLVVVMTASNLVSVRAYGEFEFWLASVKVAAISVFLFLGAIFILGLWPTATPHLANLTGHGGFAPNGILPIFSGAVVATGFYFGAEIVAIAGGEADEPSRAIASATNSVVSRVLVFYVCSIFLVVAIVPWNSAAVATPYASALRAMGVPGAGQLMNAVILTAVLSALNSGLYASSRMLLALTRRGDAPALFGRVNRRGVPVAATLAGTVVSILAIAMSYVSPDTVFAFLVDSYGTVALFVYVLIAFSQLRLRRRLERDAPEKLVVRMWLYPWLTYFALVVMAVNLVAMGFIPSQRVPLMVGVVSGLIVISAYGLRGLFQGQRGDSARRWTLLPGRRET
jgi:GABA permease